jgi:uncharacterized phage infection (PIP) family protein YhgE
MNNSISEYKSKIEEAKSQYNKALGKMSALKEQAMQNPRIASKVKAGNDLAQAIKLAIEETQTELNDKVEALNIGLAQFENKYAKFLKGGL